MDFSIKTFIKLLDSLQKQGFLFQTFAEFIIEPGDRVIILRHDVDRLPENSLEFARIQSEKSIHGTYYFRTVPESWNERIFTEIHSLGHEIGYHYENLGLTAQRHKGITGEEELVNAAIEDFKSNLSKLRELVPVKTICMHGSPLSKWDSRLLWNYYDYKDFGIIGEPYFDINFDEALYLTDTGRRWDGEFVSVRDKVSGVPPSLRFAGQSGRQASGENPYIDWKVSPVNYRQKPQKPAPSTQKPVTSTQKPATRNPQPATFPRFHSTNDIIRSAEKGELPDRIMMTFHPQRWTDKSLPWVKELIWQNAKNVGKYFLVKTKALRR